MQVNCTASSSTSNRTTEFALLMRCRCATHVAHMDLCAVLSNRTMPSILDEISVPSYSIIICNDVTCVDLEVCRQSCDKMRTGIFVLLMRGAFGIRLKLEMITEKKRPLDNRATIACNQQKK